MKSRISSDPFRHRYFIDALSVSMNTIVRHAMRLPEPLVFSVRSCTVANTLSIALVGGVRASRDRIESTGLLVTRTSMTVGGAGVRLTPRGSHQEQKTTEYVGIGTGSGARLAGVRSFGTAWWTGSRAIHDVSERGGVQHYASPRIS